MLIYNSQYELMAISNRLLSMLGIQNSDEFFAEHSDVSDFFINDEGYVYSNEQSYLDMILNDDCLCNKNALLRLVCGNIIEVSIIIETLKSKNGENLYYVNLIQNHQKNSFVPEDTQNTLMLEIEPPKLRMPSFFVNNKQLHTQEEEININLDEDWFNDTLDALGTTKDDLKGFLRDFNDSARAKNELLQESILLHDKAAIKDAIDFLKDPAADLNLTPIVAILDRIQKDDEDSGALFDEYVKCLNNLEELLKRV